MIDLKKVNKWSAEKCGISCNERMGFFLTIEGAPCLVRWTIDDARCREIVRENFKIDTIHDGIGSFLAAYYTIDMYASGKGDSIKEAEIACIIAIMESEND